MEEVLAADMVYLMSEGRIVASGTPGQIFDQVPLVKSLGLDVPTHTDIAHQIADLTAQALKPMEAVEVDTAGTAIVRMLDAASDDVLDTLSIRLRQSQKQTPAQSPEQKQ